jgi:NAD(P)-dependent dehydrogenase (short-subunit alcohol dehydrogenase family)
MVGPRSVLITGASSGIGRALALACAGPGVVEAKPVAMDTLLTTNHGEDWLLLFSPHRG